MTYQTFNISLPRDLVAAMDRAAKEEYRSRSDLIREAVRTYLADMRAWQAIFAYGERSGKAKRIRSEAQVARIVGAYRKGT